jgi:ribose 5-phosphate isomerase A
MGWPLSPTACRNDSGPGPPPDKIGPRGARVQSGGIAAKPLRQVDGRPFITDNGNVILDCAVGPISDPERLEMAIHTVPGVVGTGLFVEIAHTVLVGEPSGVKELRRRS